MTDIEAKLIREQPRFKGIGKLKRKIGEASFAEIKDEEALDFAGAVLSAADKEKRVFCSDFISEDMIKLILSNGCEPVFIDIAEEDWNLDPEVLKPAFEKYPDVKTVITHETPDECSFYDVCGEHEIRLIEEKTVLFSGAQPDREADIYDCYAERLEKSGLMYMDPLGISCLICDCGAGYETDETQHGTSSPDEIKEVLEAFGAKSRRLSIPLHMRTEYSTYDHITLDGSVRDWKYGADSIWERSDESRFIYEHGLLLPNDNSITAEEQDHIIEIIYSSFDAPDFSRDLWIAAKA
ncbi:MAG: hypothetical protein J5966_02105 [Lachnospiraceae bacterium]|nr:hypothetical protein [Lachnospiraceae bacterium]